MSAWVVVIEWGLCDGEPEGFDAALVEVVLEQLSDLDPVAMCAPDRYALQLRVRADGALEAISRALGRHDDALRELPVGGQLLRLELLTPGELDDQSAHFANRGTGLRALHAAAGDPVAEASAALNGVSGPEEATRVLTRLVHQLGGGVVGARAVDEWTMPLDISFGAGEARMPIAEPWSGTRMRLEEVLPPLIAKASALLREAHRPIAPADRPGAPAD